MSYMWVLARYALLESSRRRVFLVVPIVTVAFLALYALGVHYAFDAATGRTQQAGGGLVDTDSLVGATLVGLAMFAELFFGAVLGVFLTFNTVRGDAETGLLQTLVVRPVGRRSILLGRFFGASLLCSTYILIVYVITTLITGIIGGWWPHPFLLPGLALAAGVVVITALSVLGSVYLTAIPNGIVVLMLYLGGLLGGLLKQIGDALDISKLSTTGKVIGYVVPFEALYQAGLNWLTSGVTGFARVIVQLGPFGGAEAGGVTIWIYAIVYVLGLTALAVLAFNRRDL